MRPKNVRTSFAICFYISGNLAASELPPNNEPDRSGRGFHVRLLHCRAAREDLRVYGSLRGVSIDVDAAKRHVKMVHNGDYRTFALADGATSARE
jgi:hypothetical protein